MYIKTTVDQISGKWQSKNTTIFVGTIIYQLHVSAVIGHLQVRIRQRKISIISIGMGGRDLVYGVCGRIGFGASMCSLGVYTPSEHERPSDHKPHIFVNEISSAHTYTYNRYFPLTLYPNLKMAYQGRNM